MAHSTLAALKRDLVVEIIAARFIGSLAAVAAARQHDEFAVMGLQHDLSGEVIFVVPAGPLTGLERTLDVNLATLAQVGFDDVGELGAEHHDAVPFDPLAALAAVFVGQVSLVAIARFTTLAPLCIVRISGSRGSRSVERCNI